MSAEFVDINHDGNSVAHEGKTGKFTAATFSKLRVWFVTTNALFRLVLFIISMVCLCSRFFKNLSNPYLCLNPTFYGS